MHAFTQRMCRGAPEKTQSDIFVLRAERQVTLQQRDRNVAVSIGGQHNDIFRKQMPIPDREVINPENCEVSFVFD